MTSPVNPENPLLIPQLFYSIKLQPSRFIRLRVKRAYQFLRVQLVTSRGNISPKVSSEHLARLVGLY